MTLIELEAAALSPRLGEGEADVGEGEGGGQRGGRRPWPCRRNYND